MARSLIQEVEVLLYLPYIPDTGLWDIVCIMLIILHYCTVHKGIVSPLDRPILGTRS